MPNDDELELWGGLECTVVRTGDEFRNQAVETGHHARPDDLERIASLGIRTLRYPIVWETIAPDSPSRRNWVWHDDRLSRIRALGIRPVAGLIHHGSGPRYTDLLSPDFPRMFARHAAQVARRYPWIDLYTPVNEPLTTARFSGLYGHWYPHAHGYDTFLRALVNQCRATVLAMRAIRRVNPRASLVQTEDLGRTFATPSLSYQAYHENERRWLSFDLLFGRVDRQHPWWQVLRDHGISDRELAFFREGDGRPDIVGINHYLTSDRFLDENLHGYPEHLHGGNEFTRFADVEAVRVPLPTDELGVAARLREAWERYGTTLVVTEAHHGCTRDEQLRWLHEVWQGAKTLRAEGADIKAVTVWSLFGTVDWNTLLTRNTGIYEPGAFDIRGQAPRPTALASAAKSLASTGSFDHPVLGRPGWWHRGTRFYHHEHRTERDGDGSGQSLMVIGDGDALADTLCRFAEARGLDMVVVAPDEHEVAEVYATLRPWGVVDLTLCHEASEGREPCAWLPELCRRDGISYMAFSSDRVFDGRLGHPYIETDPVSPITAAARRLASREVRILAEHPGAIVIRTGPLFGPTDPNSLPWRLLHAIADGKWTDPASDLISPTYLPDLVHVALDLLIDGESGLWHLAGGTSISEAEIGRELAHRVGLPPPPVAFHVIPRLDRSLSTGRGVLMPPLASALDRFVRDCGSGWRSPPESFGIAAE